MTLNPPTVIRKKERFKTPLRIVNMEMGVGEIGFSGGERVLRVLTFFKENKNISPLQKR